MIPDACHSGKKPLSRKQSMSFFSRPFWISSLALLPLFSALAIPLSADEATSRATIWKLSDENSTVYLAGSVHLLREKDLPIPAAYDQVYEKSDELVFEIDMKEMTDPTLALKMKELGTLPEGKTLSDILPADVVAKLTGYLESTGLPAALFERMTPGMVFITISSIQALKTGANPNLGLEMTYYQKSTNDNKPSRGLETMEYQISRFNEIEKDRLGELISHSIDNAEETPKILDKIINSWKAGNAEQLEAVIVKEMEEQPDVKEVLLTQRNKNWIPEIEKALAGDKTVLFLVGAAHLVGTDSVIDLLEKKGHKPEQIGSKVPVLIKQ
jgi:uncharacterized protein YbaP (TraB family)